MANRRMFARSVVETDAFLDMPASAQALYFHLGMAADDEGFLGNARSVQRSMGASADDLKVLEGKSYIVVFDTGVVYLPHWAMNNQIRKDRFTATAYQAERLALGGVSE